MTPPPGRRQPPKVPRPEPVERADSPTVGALLAEPDPAAAIDEWWADVRLPLVEDVGVPGRVLVTFCWRDAEAEEVLLFANRLTDETRLGDSLLTWAPGTDLWYVGYLLEPDWRASYAFLVRDAGAPAPWAQQGDQASIRAALDRGRPDPRNPRTCRNRAGVVQSVAELPDAPAQPWLEPRPGTATGALAVEIGPLGRELTSYAAPGVGDGSPLLVVLDGEVWTGVQSLPTTLDNLVADAAIPPLRAVFLASGGRDARWSDMGGEAGDATAAYVIDHLLPELDRRGWLPAPDRVAVVGQSLGGLTALRIALARPDLVGRALSQSASLWLDDLEAEIAALSDRPGERPRIDLAHGRQEWVLAGPHDDLARRLGDAGIPVVATAHNGGHDYAWWRGAVAEALVRSWPGSK